MSHPPFRIFVPSRGPVLAVAMGSNSEYCYSGGADACIHSWKIPDLSMDPYDGYGEDNAACLPLTSAGAWPSPPRTHTSRPLLAQHCRPRECM